MIEGQVGAALPLVRIQELQVSFTGGKRPVHAVSGVNLEVARGEVVALIGESGSGKSVTLRSILRLHAAKTTLISGKIEVAGQDVLGLSRSALADFRGKTAAMIFQEPLLALDPVYTVGQQIVESIQRQIRAPKHHPTLRVLGLFLQALLELTDHGGGLRSRLGLCPRRCVPVPSRPE